MHYGSNEPYDGQHDDQRAELDERSHLATVRHHIGIGNQHEHRQRNEALDKQSDGLLRKLAQAFVGTVDFSH